MNLAARILLALLMLVLAGFCVLGFVVTFENNPAFGMNPPSVRWMWRGIYALAAFASIGTAIRFLWPRRRG
jgi:hypothetical protein